MMGIDYRGVAALAAVVEEEGFEKAAKVLNMTQSGVSQRVRQLEEQTGRILLKRSSPPVPTPSGTQLLKHFIQVRHLENDLFRELSPSSGHERETLAVGINADSIATWFLEAMGDFLKRRNVLIDLRVDDQDETHRLLRNGDVIGCISSLDRAVQGCTIRPIGHMNYRMAASVEFVRQWFGAGVTLEAVRQAPLLVFNRKDRLQFQVLETVFGCRPDRLPIMYLPSSERFLDAVLSGLAYGMLPDIQTGDAYEKNILVDLFPACALRVPLFWHCWNLKSHFLEEFSRELISRAGKVLRKRTAN